MDMDTEAPHATIQHRNPQTQAGFTMVPNVILTATHLSQGARLLYALLKMYAWQNDKAWPGMDRLAGELGVSTRQTHTYMNELSAAHLITVERRGLTQTNRYIVEDIPDDFTSDRKPTSTQEAKPTSTQDRQSTSTQDRQSTSDKEDSDGNKTQKKKRETGQQEPTSRGDTQTPPVYPTPVACQEPAEPEVRIPIPPGTPVNRRPDAPPREAHPIPKPPARPALLKAWQPDADTLAAFETECRRRRIDPAALDVVGETVKWKLRKETAGLQPGQWSADWQFWLIRAMERYQAKPPAASQTVSGRPYKVL